MSALASTALALAVVLAASWAVRLAMRLERTARAAHELRAPLCAARLALHSAGRETGWAAVDPVDRALARAALALEDLDAARTGRPARAERGRVDAVDVLEQVRDSWAPLAWPTGREVRVEAGAAGAAVLGDDRRIAQALGTLVGNALEHGRGTVVLSVRTWAGRVRFEVADDGPGPQRSLPRLVRRRRTGGGSRGRGLAIAAEIARDHGGRLRHEPGGSCRMVLELPVASAPHHLPRAVPRLVAHGEPAPRLGRPQRAEDVPLPGGAAPVAEADPVGLRWGGVARPRFGRWER